MFNLHSFVVNFSLMRRLHLSLLLPAVLTYFVLLYASINSVYAETIENQVTINLLVPQNPTLTDDVISREKNQNVYTWEGNVEFRYEPKQILATAEKAEYFQSEQKVVLTGKVKVTQQGISSEAETVTFFVTEQFKITADRVMIPGSK
ncbi:LptA/OstA family protein [Calothrix sp. UHCC 0171]|uniref:LptA/OstA family protein n=1 Tax=Calothrix sp. UHCC 0171 TaxID=3110245 RepID=UPI002B2056E5|nr:LptA/OstA family protein [Calothrix sp. UHCC 0171]MEA5569591.1 LptA/OstA family protein [Calothrix sp. UHCC 0171]